MLEQVIISVQIILIDIVMAADNAIIIGLIAAGFATENRRKIIAWGVAAAFLFRIIFASGANYLFEFAWIKILGGVLLLWVINNLRQDFFGKNKIKTPQLKSAETKSFSVGVMVIGLLLSVFLIATLASYFAEYIKKHMWLGYLGLFVILVISIQLIIGGLVSYEVLSINEKYKFLFL